MTTCRPTDDGYRLDGEHYDGCEDDACPGCFPCVPRTDHGDPLTHCTARWRCAEHVEPGTLSCPKCVGKTRRKVRRIAELTALLPAAAVESGRVDSEAANLAGPAADPDGWSHRKVAERQAIRARHADDEAAMWAALDALPDDDPSHPAAVLGTWQRLLEEDPRGCYPRRSEGITVAGAADYLDGVLDRFAQDDEQDFGLFTREVAACLTRVEQVLAVARYAETGAPCPSCPQPVDPATGNRKAAPRLELVRGTLAVEDRWRCPVDRTHAWSDHEYRKRVSDDYLHNADRLTIPDMERRTRVPASTLRRWANVQRRGGEEVPALIKSCGRTGDGRKMYRVSDVLALREDDAL